MPLDPAGPIGLDSDPSNWTIERELCKLAQAESVERALVLLGVVGAADALQGITEERAWFASGAETYLYVFRVDTRTRQVRLALKACAKFGPAIAIDAQVAEWVLRRRTLAAAGIATPRLYHHGSGVLLEEFIPHSLSDLLDHGSLGVETVLPQLVQIAATLYLLGFPVVAVFPDLRSRGADVVMVDFGEDLGPAGVPGAGDPQILHQLDEYLRKRGHPVTDIVREEIRATFQRQMKTNRPEPNSDQT